MTNKQTRKKRQNGQEKVPESIYLLILHNDDVHSFDYVINALTEVCAHKFEQAVQCALITHYKGSCDICKGPFIYIEKMKNRLLQKNLSVTISSLS
ncbi:MAG: ATP-dependent Clp protease adaptor ClpS [Bacteroidales bacterium]|nr:ATP-dependent Clp protease adaptor ClpS [Bacteroidales bacterium]